VNANEGTLHVRQHCFLGRRCNAGSKEAASGDGGKTPERIDPVCAVYTPTARAEDDRHDGRIFGGGRGRRSSG